MADVTGGDATWSVVLPGCAVIAVVAVVGSAQIGSLTSGGTAMAPTPRFFGLTLNHRDVSPPSLNW